MRTAIPSIALAVMLGACTLVEPQAARPSTRAVDPATPAASPSDEPAEARPAKAARIERTDDGRCTPQPRVGEPCEADQGWCIESWGAPGGHSSALWCRDGKWMREQEVNLPE